ncbi:uncharacterized protein LOC133902012 [Phragmites australis]|uniref:uncharacterized protein LOC133902012 n=1 Tax=Phragmites australis TaxID=29695 RepID=UPI002D785A1B|nr:uncharacterized protein LOC133902012 [Phragmites australis]
MTSKLDKRYCALVEMRNSIASCIGSQTYERNTNMGDFDVFANCYVPLHGSVQHNLIIWMARVTRPLGQTNIELHKESQYGAELLFYLLYQHKKYVTNAKSLEIFLVIAQKVRLRWIQMMSALVEAEL